MCVCAFLFVQRGGKILLGKYADDPAWERLTGLDPDRRRVHGRGWTVPATHLKYGEAPETAARRVGEEVLRLRGMEYSEPWVDTELYEPRRHPGVMHYDIRFLFDAAPPDGVAVEKPPWYTALEWHKPGMLSREAFSRGHEDVIERWTSLQEGAKLPRADRQSWRKK
jgi:ADP-ribose pyrophosphatase YjhB (NUDIX family)